MSVTLHRDHANKFGPIRQTTFLTRSLLAARVGVGTAGWNASRMARTALPDLPRPRGSRLVAGTRLRARRVRARPDRASAIATLAHALLVNDAPTEALEMATNSLKAGGDEPNGNLIRSIALNRLGRTTEARDAYAVAQRLLVTSRQGDAVRRVLLRLAARETGLTGPTSP